MARSRGFTLLELVIAMTLMGLVLVMVYGGLRLGLRGWDSSTQRAARLDEVRLAQSFIRRQLNQSPAVFYNDPRQGRVSAFQGDDRSVAWVTPLLAQLGLGGLYYVQLDLVEAEAGTALRMRWRPFRPSEPTVGEDEETLLLEGVSALRWSYFGAEEPGREPHWQDRWQSLQQRPRLVRLSLILEEEAWPDMIAQLPGG